MIKYIFVVMVAAISLIGCDYSSGPIVITNSNEAKPTPKILSDGKIKSMGVFVGKSDHITNGDVTIRESETGVLSVVLEKTFDFDGAPAPIVALGKDGYKKDTNLGKLANDQGRQSYQIPPDLKVEDYNEVWIWCTKFDVPLGVAKLTVNNTKPKS